MVAPETALTGYFLEGGVRDLALSADQLFDDLAGQHRDAKAPPFDVALGFYEVHQNRLYNSAIYATLGGPDAGIRHVHRKVFLPTYGVFDEERFVEAGRSVQAFDTPWGRAAILICEDAWHSFTPMLAALDGAQLIIVPSASPARGPVPGRRRSPGRPASLGRWSRIVQDIAGEHGVYVALAQLVGFEGGKAFAGGSIVAVAAGRPAGARADLRGGADPGDARLRGDHPGARRPAAARGSGDAAAASAGITARGAAGEGAERRDGGTAEGRRRSDRCRSEPRGYHARKPPRPPFRRSRRLRAARPPIRSPSTPSSPAAGWSSSCGTKCSAAAGSRKW